MQLKFLIQLSQTFGLNGAVVAEVTELNLRAGEHTNEATISPGGPWLLGQDDLYELAEPLCRCEKTQQGHHASPQLNGCFSEVDRLVCDQPGRGIQDRHRQHDCRVLFADTGFCDVQFEDRRTKVTLSRLALAMALRERDLMLDSLNVTQAIS